MIRILAALALVIGVHAGHAQGTATSGIQANAAQQETNEKVRRLQAELEDMKVLVGTLRVSVDKLSRELSDFKRLTLMSQNAAKAAQSDKASQSALESLARSVREVETNRKADQAQVVKKFSELRKLILEVSSNARRAAAPAPPRRSSPPPPDSPKGTYHTVEKGQTLFAILAAYQDALKAEGSKYRLTLDKLKRANPKLNPDMLLVGQRLFIPLED